MRILHVINALGSGGTERNLINYVNNDKKNHHAICCSSYNKFYKSKITKEYLTRKKFNYLNFINNFFYIKKIIEIEKPEIINFWMYRSCIYSIIFKIFYKKKIIWNLRNGGDLKYFNFRNKVEYYIVCLFSYLIPDATIFNSYTSLKNHRKNGYSKKSNFVIFNGFEFNKKKNIKINKKFLSIGMVARFNYFKNHKLLFQTLSKINTDVNFRLFLIGKGINYKNNELMKLIRKFNLNKSIVLIEESKKVFKILNKLDLHILVSNNESFPNVVAEAAYYSCISISSYAGDVKK